MRLKSKSLIYKSSTYVVAGIGSLILAALIFYHASRQRVPPEAQLQVVSRQDVAEVSEPANFGIPYLSDTYLLITLRDGRVVRYGDWIPEFRRARGALLSRKRIRLWVGIGNQFEAVYQVEIEGRMWVPYREVAAEMHQDAVLAIVVASGFGLMLAPYFLWHARKLSRTSRPSG
ncbi:MAG: hypothetical protein ACJ8R9_18905 [Steroidobacteraceae bacterium]